MWLCHRGECWRRAQQWGAGRALPAGGSLWAMRWQPGLWVGSRAQVPAATGAWAGESVLAAPETSLAPSLLELVTEELNGHLPVLLLLLQFLFLSWPLQNCLCLWDPRRNKSACESLVQHLFVLFHWAFATCCPCVRESVLSCDDQSTSHFSLATAQLTAPHGC